MGLVGSCCGSLLATCACSGLQACAPKTSAGAKVFYCVLLALATVLALIARFWLTEGMLVDLWVFTLKFCTSSRCRSIGAVLRVSFATTTFFGIHAGAAAAGANPDRWNFIGKLFGWMVLLVLSFFLPEQFYLGFAHVCRFAGGVFLLLQIVVLVDSICRWQEKWMALDMRKAVLGVSLGAYLASLTALVLLFHYFGGDGCATNNALIALCLVSTLLFTGLSVSGLSQHGVMPASLVCLYCYWVLFSALSSDPSDCNTTQSDHPVFLIAGIVLAALSIAWAAWSVSSATAQAGGLLENASSSRTEAREDDESDAEENPAVATRKSPAEVEAAGGGSGSSRKKAFAVAHPQDDPDLGSGDARRGGAGAYDSTPELRFHLLMALAAMYMAMLLSNWATPQDADRKDYAVGTETMWVKVVTQWATALLYSWTFVAPLVLRNRNFD